MHLAAAVLVLEPFVGLGNFLIGASVDLRIAAPNYSALRSSWGTSLSPPRPS